MADTDIKCKNCDTALVGEYCHRCGQEVRDADSLSFKKMVLYTIHELFDYDSKIINTVKKLFLKPGFLTNEYLDGKTTKYLNPIRLYLTVSVIYFVFFSFFPKDSITNLNPFIDNDPSGYVKNEILKRCAATGGNYEQCLQKINIRFNEVLSVVMYFFVIGYAGLLYLMFYKKRKYYVEHLVFSIHFFCYGLLRDILVEPVFLINSACGYIIGIVTSLSYLFFAVRKTYGLSALNAVVCTLLIYIGFWMVASIVAVPALIYVLKLD
jgi:hypothetical protein